MFYDPVSERWELGTLGKVKYIVSISSSGKQGNDKGPRLWNPHFTKRSRAAKMQIVRTRRLPLAALHLAAIEAQRHARGHLVRKFVSIATSSRSLRAPYVPKKKATETKLPANEMNLISKFLDSKMRSTNLEARDQITFNEWCATRLQAWWRMLPFRKYFMIMRFLVLNVAALDIQAAYQEYKIRINLQRQPFNIADAAASKIQMVWRTYTNTRIFRYYRDLIKFREQGDPRVLLRCINPREAGAIDPAAQLHVRFRLGGAVFPPNIYYKIFTHGSVTDICSFAPRDYTVYKKKDPKLIHNKPKPGYLVFGEEDHAGWYQRVENNGWRPVSDKVVRDMDGVTLSSAARAIPDFHYSKLRRRENTLQKRKQKKIEWLQKMYKAGATAGGEAGSQSLAQKPASAVGHLEGEDEDVDELLEWTEGLDFDKYYNNWLTLATSSRSSQGGFDPSLEMYTEEELSGIDIM